MIWLFRCSLIHIIKRIQMPWTCIHIPPRETGYTFMSVFVQEQRTNFLYWTYCFLWEIRIWIGQSSPGLMKKWFFAAPSKGSANQILYYHLVQHENLKLPFEWSTQEFNLKGSPIHYLLGSSSKFMEKAFQTKDEQCRHMSFSSWCLRKHFCIQPRYRELNFPRRHKTWSILRENRLFLWIIIPGKGSLSFKEHEHSL